MEFCSKYGYNYGFEGSDSEEYNDEDERTKVKTKKKIRQADTNIIAVKFDQLVQPNEMFAGEPKGCKKCGAIMSFLSEKNTKKENDKLIWTCEFCEEVNDMSSVVDDLNEIPKKDDVTFMLEVPKPKEAKNEAASTAAKSDKPVSTDDSYLGFCIDISGSMDTHIPAKDGVNSGFTRLSGIKAACMETLKGLKDEEPQKRVALITFSDQVKYFGDCTEIRNNKPILNIGGGSGYYQAQQRRQQPYQQQQQVRPTRFQKIRNLFSSNKAAGSGSGSAGSDEDDNQQQQQQQQPQQEVESTAADLQNKERILTLANNLNPNVKGINTSYPSIEGRIKDLRTEGSTALGPALLFSIGFASKKPGSSIILCTDGAANVGLGAVESTPGEKSEKFYDDLADYAKEKSVVVNVISMEGTDCKLSLLGRVADKSNGSMTIVNPLNLGEEFKSILQNRLVATNVNAKLIVNHRFLYIRDDNLEGEEGKAIDAGDEKAKENLDKIKQSIVNRNVGNANIDTEITFEYGIRKLKDEKKEELKKMPFQLQVTYTAQDGTKAVRVYTKVLEFTTDRAEAERNLVAEDIIFAHNAQMISKQALNSNIVASKYRSEAVDKLMYRNQMAAPQMYADFSSKVKGYSKSKKASAYNDEEAEEAFSNAKMSRVKLNKKK